MEDSEDKLINTECELRKRQSEIGNALIYGSCIVCILVGILPIASAGLNEDTPPGTTAQIVLSDSYLQLIVYMSIPFLIGLTAGIILLKSSVKHVAKSYFEEPVDDDEE